MKAPAVFTRIILSDAEPTDGCVAMQAHREGSRASTSQYNPASLS